MFLLLVGLIVGDAQACYPEEERKEEARRQLTVPMLQQKFLDFASENSVKLWFDDIGGRFSWSVGVHVPRHYYPESYRVRLYPSYVKIDYILYRMKKDVTAL